MVHLAVQNHVETANDLFDGHHDTFHAGEFFCHGERLAQEALHASSAVHGDAVFLREFVHAEDGDDVLKFFVFLEDLLHALCTLIVCFSDDLGVKDAGGGFQRIHGGVDTQLCDFTAEHRGGIQVGEGGGRCRVGQVVGGHIDCLNGSDGAVSGGGDAFLHRTHFAGECRLITHGGGHTSHQGRHLTTSLCEAEDVVDEEKDVCGFAVFGTGIAETLGDGESGESHGGTCAGRFVHLSIDEGGLTLFHFVVIHF